MQNLKLIESGYMKLSAACTSKENFGTCSGRDLNTCLHIVVLNLQDYK